MPVILCDVGTRLSKLQTLFRWGTRDNTCTNCCYCYLTIYCLFSSWSTSYICRRSLWVYLFLCEMLAPFYDNYRRYSGKGLVITLVLTVVIVIWSFIVCFLVGLHATYAADLSEFIYFCEMLAPFYDNYRRYSGNGLVITLVLTVVIVIWLFIVCSLVGLQATYAADLSEFIYFFVRCWHPFMTITDVIPVRDSW